MNRRLFYIVALALTLALSDATLTPAGQDKKELVNEVTVVNTGQKWSPAQMEIWKTVEAYWTVPTIEGLMAYFHPEFMGWSTDAPMPHDRAAVHLQFINEFNNRTTQVIEITPAGVKVHDTVAIVNYHYHWLYRDNDGKQHVEKGRYTDILMKQAGKWMLIGDHGGPDPAGSK